MPATSSRIDIRVLGALGVSIDGHEIGLTPVERNLLAILAASGPSGLDTDRIADQLWPDELPRSWRASFRNNVSRLNRKVADRHEGARLISEGPQERRLLVDPSAVDLWRLLDWVAEPDRVDATIIQGDPTLLAGAPFPTCELSPILRESAELVAAHRRDLIAYWAKQGERLPHRILVALRRLSLDDPYNEPLAESVVELHLAVAEHATAASLLDELLIEVPLSDALVDLRESLRLQRQPSDLGPTVRRATFPKHSPSIARLSEDSVSGRSELLDELLGVIDNGANGVALHGDGGVGKTRLAVELAAQLGASGHHSAYIVGDRQCFGSLQPFLDAFPELSELLADHLADLNDMAVQAQCRQKVLDYLSSTYSGYPLCLVVDDAHWLDDQSSALTMALVRAGLPDGLIVIGVGRSTDDDQRWPAWLSELSRAGIRQFKVRPLSRDEMVEMIRATHGELEQIGVRSLAGQVLNLSSGIPGVARWLLERADLKTMSIHTADVEGTGYDAMVNSLTEKLRWCGAVASVFGLRFQVEDLGNLLGAIAKAPVDPSEELERLAARGLIDELAVPGTYRFAHILAAEAFEQSLSPADRVALHAAAFHLFEDPLRQARHAPVAALSIGHRTAADTLVASARLRYAEGNYGAAISDLQAAMELDPTAAELDDRILSLEAAERSGMRATAQRDHLVTEAIAAGDMTLAFRAAMTGLPDAEALEGDPARVEVLERIDPELLSMDDRVKLHVQRSRQLFLVDRIGDAEQQAAIAAHCATTADQQAEAWLAGRLAISIGGQVDADEAWPSTDEIASEKLRLRMSQAKALDAIASGGSSTQWRTIDEHATRVSDVGHPQLDWMAQIFIVTARTDQGRLQDARELAQRAHQFGLGAGIRVAEGTYQTQVFAWEMLARNHGWLFPIVVDGGPDDVAANIIFQAAVAACHVNYATDDVERQRAHQRVRSACNQAMRSSFDLAAIGIMADAIGATGDDHLMEWASDRLVTKGGRYLLLASAGANLGPQSLVLAKVAPSRRATLELVEQSIRDADEDRLPLWQVITRLDLAEHLGPDDGRSQTLTAEARDVACTPWLRSLIEERGASA